MLMRALAGNRRNLTAGETRSALDRVLEMVVGTQRTRADVRVTATRALGYSPVWCLVSLLQDDVAKIPLITQQTTIAGDGAETVTARRDHPCYSLFRRSTDVERRNGRITSNAWLKVMMFSRVLFGSGLTLIRRSGPMMRPSRLIYVPKDDWRIKKVNVDDTPQRVFEVKDPETGKTSFVDENDVIHIPGMTVDGWQSLSLIEFARESIGRSVAAEDWGADFFGKGQLPQGYFSTEQDLTKDRIADMAAMFVKNHAERNMFGILPNGLEFKGTGIKPSDALLIDNLKWGVKDVARFGKVPVHKLGDTEANSAYNSLEQENESYFGSSIDPHLCAIEFAINDKCFTSDELAAGYEVEFDRRKFKRGDMKTRAEYYSKGVMSRWLRPSDARRMEGLNPIDGIDDEPLPGTTPATEPPSDDDSGTRAMMADMLSDDLRGRVRAMVNQVRAKAGKKQHSSRLPAAVYELRSNALPVAQKISLALPSNRAGEAMKAAEYLIETVGGKLLEVAETCEPCDLGDRLPDAIGPLNERCRELAQEILEV